MPAAQQCYNGGRMEDSYKGHRIKSAGWRIAQTVAWKPHVIIMWVDDTSMRLQPFTLNRAFTSKEEAETDGYTFAKKWIDAGKPEFLPLSAW